MGGVAAGAGSPRGRTTVGTVEVGEVLAPLEHAAVEGTAVHPEHRRVVRNVEIAVGKVDQRLLTIERVVLPSNDQPGE